MTPEIRRTINGLESRLAQMERERRQYWSVPMVGGVTTSPSYLWQVVAGSTIPSLGILGIPRTNALIVPSTLPDGPPGTGIIVVPPYPFPMGLPAGIGVAQRIDANNGPSVYSFIRTDPLVNNLFSSKDILVGECLFMFGSTYLDKVVGGTTWRYVCASGPISFY